MEVYPYAMTFAILETKNPLTIYQNKASSMKKKALVSLHISPGGQGPHAM